MRGSITGSAISLSIVKTFQETTIEKPTRPLNLDDMKENWSHKLLLQKSSLMSMESCSVTLTQTVVAIQTVANSYCDNLTRLGTLLSLTSDGLPVAYTVEELYDRVVELKTQMKSDKQQLIELQTLFSYVRKMMDSVAETSFLVGAEYVSLQASSRLNEAETQIKQEMDKTERLELEYLHIENESIKQFSKEKEKAEKEKTNNKDLKLSIDDVQRKVDELVPVNELDVPEEADIPITAIQETFSEEQKSGDLSIFNSDEDIKISVKSEEDEDPGFRSDGEMESERTDDKPDDNGEPPRYKFPTF